MEEACGSLDSRKTYCLIKTLYYHRNVLFLFEQNFSVVFSHVVEKRNMPFNNNEKFNRFCCRFYFILTCCPTWVFKVPKYLY